MDEFTAVEAAKWLGVSREAVDLAAREGRLPVVGGDGPRRFSREAVEEFHQGKQAEKIAKLARSGETPESAAAKVRRGLFANGTGLPRPFAVKLAAMPESWRSLFSRADLTAAGVPDGECRWCKAVEFSAFLGLRPPEYAPARVELFGGPPCGVCGPPLIRPYMQALERRVHPGRHRPPDARAEAVAAAAAAVPPVPRPQPARPVQGGDGGRALVSRRRREVQARLKDARRRGDTSHAMDLQRQLQSLTADAAAVDYGRSAVTAASRPGTLRCGHQLSAGCGCPRRSSTRGQQ